MINIRLDMVQYDCPFVRTTDDHDVSFAVLHWDFDRKRRRLETRLAVEADDDLGLTNAIDELRSHDQFYELECLSKRGDSATLRTTIGETHAMGTIREFNGYVTGPFHIEDGSEMWNIGFDTTDVADDALEALEKENEFTVESRTGLDVDEVWDLSRNVDTALTLIDGCNTLTDTERQTIETAFRRGFFNTPRDATLENLGDEMNVSGPAVSKNLRRAQRKITGHVVEALDLEASR